jgi:hypothetical protein
MFVRLGISIREDAGLTSLLAGLPTFLSIYSLPIPVEQWYEQILSRITAAGLFRIFT